MAYWALASFRLAKRRGITQENYENTVEDTIFFTMVEQVADNRLALLLEAHNAAPLPRGRHFSDLVEGLLENAPTVRDKLALLSHVHTDLAAQGAQSRFYIEAIQLLDQFL